ncbi:hypothetical protein POJ06DRAFT_247604, partial [Lipomyces tetrasporus]
MALALLYSSRIYQMLAPFVAIGVQTSTSSLPIRLQSNGPRKLESGVPWYPRITWPMLHGKLGLGVLQCRILLKDSSLLGYCESWDKANLCDSRTHCENELLPTSLG